MKALRVDKEAGEELEAAASWYEEQRPGLGDEFLQSIDEAVAQLEAFPTAGSLHPHVPLELNVRRILARRFPYAVVYIELTREIRILAFAHMKRRPGYWIGRYSR